MKILLKLPMSCGFIFVLLIWREIAVWFVVIIEMQCYLLFLSREITTWYLMTCVGIRSNSWLSELLKIWLWGITSWRLELKLDWDWLVWLVCLQSAFWFRFVAPIMFYSLPMKTTRNYNQIVCYALKRIRVKWRNSMYVWKMGKIYLN